MGLIRTKTNEVNNRKLEYFRPQIDYMKLPFQDNMNRASNINLIDSQKPDWAYQHFRKVAGIRRKTVFKDKRYTYMSKLISLINFFGEKT